MAEVAIATQVASTAMSAYGMFQQGEAAKKAAKYQQGVAKINEQIAKQNAEWQRRAGEVQAQKVGMVGRFKIGTTKAIQSGRGLDINSGSNLAVRESEEDLAEYDQATVRTNAAWKAYGEEVQAAAATSQGAIYGMQASQASAAAGIGAASSILGGTASVADKWMQYQSTFGSGNPTDVGSATSTGSFGSSGAMY